MKECLQCKNQFEPSKPKQKFCNSRCKTRYHRSIEKAQKEKVPYVCLPSGEILVIDEKIKQKVLSFAMAQKKEKTSPEPMPEVGVSAEQPEVYDMPEPIKVVNDEYPKVTESKKELSKSEQLRRLTEARSKK